MEAALRAADNVLTLRAQRIVELETQVQELRGAVLAICRLMGTLFVPEPHLKPGITPEEPS